MMRLALTCQRVIGGLKAFNDLMQLLQIHEMEQMHGVLISWRWVGHLFLCDTDSISPVEALKGVINQSFPLVHEDKYLGDAFKGIQGILRDGNE